MFFFFLIIFLEKKIIFKIFEEKISHQKKYDRDAMGEKIIWKIKGTRIDKSILEKS